MSDQSTLSTPKKPQKPRAKADEWRPKFLEALRNSGNVRAACQAAHIDRSTAYKAREHSAEFQAQWNEALEEACDSLEAAAWHRARDGVEREHPHYYKDDLLSTTIETLYSDTLLIFLLKAHRPDKYRETSTVKLEGGVGLNLNMPTPEQMAQARKRADEWEKDRFGSDGNPNPEPTDI